MTYDVAIVGYGPVGAILANLLGRDGHSVLVVDQMLDIFDKPRAINIDHEVMRVLQSVGLGEAVNRIVTPHLGTDFVGLDERLIKIFNPIEPPYPLHWHPNLMFIQPEFEPILRDGVKRFARVDIRLGCKALNVAQNDEEVELEIQERDGVAPRTVRARYLVACDGAASPIRKQLEIAQDSLGFDEWWTVVDAWLRRPTPLPKRTTQFCLPAGPTTYVVGPRDLRRWELKLLPGETPRDFEDMDWVRRRLAPFVDPDAIDLWRVATYRFHALVARRWRRDRIFLAGDAAHQMPPFMAQGLCCGVRDVANLGWKLSGVLRGAYPEPFLETYEVERKPHIRQLVGTAKNLGEIIGELDIDKARERDRLLGDEVDSGRSITIRQQLIPDLTAGLIARGPDGQPAPAAGSLFLQPQVRVGREPPALLDDVIGERFAIVALGAARASWLHGTPREILKRLGGVAMILIQGGDASDRLADDIAFVDATGILEQWMKDGDRFALVVRPDKFIYGVAGSAEALHALCLSLEAGVFGKT
ncbi:bifunctional 3-(3-hydroxy-phenyl)propionate/3-hydroxycinnamic acid hydroxylase [Methylocapsa sp. S129]|uniref:bifunctional 3-(3-hydroxy-phenyl)propionate/3-hydroxycinnamic acid hydroxylase n=1 Tax=Methylocapsa sp. S129 TaxID=1641869 RepID=UPI001FEDC8E1|nr:bifunctional 3-(3-hydroxy-phenyl)propionate/3-hydroxycinnamic acid hydroxylase [Methylocapsa sp. S129]